MTKTVNLRLHNLNYLPVLLDILRHGSVTRAAESLGLSQPALSNILKQLRHDFDDPLIVRTGKSMQLSPKATTLLKPLENAMGAIQDLLAKENFDPALAASTFRIATSDYVMGLIGSSLIKLVLENAPSVKIDMAQAFHTAPEALVVGEVDIAIVPSLLMTSGLTDREITAKLGSELLMREPFVCLAHADDSGFARGLTPEEYLARPHIGYAVGSKFLSSAEQVNLTRLGVQQNNVMLLSSSAVMPGIVADTGCLALVPRSLARQAAHILPLQYAPPPIPFDPIDWMMVWSMRNDNDAAIKWLRLSLKASVMSLDPALGLGRTKADTVLSNAP